MNERKKLQRLFVLRYVGISDVEIILNDSYSQEVRKVLPCPQNIH
jgi:hypothetical protein